MIISWLVVPNINMEVHYTDTSLSHVETYRNTTHPCVGSHMHPSTTDKDDMDSLQKSSLATKYHDYIMISRP